MSRYTVSHYSRGYEVAPNRNLCWGVVDNEPGDGTLVRQLAFCERRRDAEKLAEAMNAAEANRGA